MDNMSYYWYQEFNTAFEKLENTMYTADGYNYDRIKGIENDMLIDMISLRAEILEVKKAGGLVYEYKGYTIRIYNLLGVGV